MKKEENIKLPTLDLEDIDQSFKNISNEFNFFNQRMIGIGIEFTNKMAGDLFSDKNKRFLYIRNSIQYRLNAIYFHFKLLLDIQKKYHNEINKPPSDKDKSIDYLIKGSNQQYAVFDSIVFHIVSLFDYIACLINYSCGGKYESKIMWNGIVKTSFDSQNYLSNSKLKEIVQKWNNDFIDVLFNHRSDIIHYSMDSGNTSHVYDLDKGKQYLYFEAPYKFVRNFRELKKLSKENNIMINYSVDWLIRKTIQAANDIVNGVSVFMEANRKIPKEKEIFRFRKPDEKL